MTYRMEVSSYIVSRWLKNNHEFVIDILIQSSLADDEHGVDHRSSLEEKKQVVLEEEYERNWKEQHKRDKSSKSKATS